MKNTKAIKPVTRKPNKKVTRSKKQSVAEQAFQNIMNNSNSLSRSMLSGRLGRSFDGDRDLYKTFGYVVSPGYDDYRAFYDRMGLATRMVEKFSDDTWNKPPILVDGDASSDMDEHMLTPFLAEWNKLAKRLGVTQMMRQADVMCGIGRYSTLFLGTSGDYEQPVKGQHQLFYLSAFDEKQAGIDKLISDPKNEKYGMPEKYTITMDNPENTVATIPREVHYTRVIHISENRLGSRVYGRPRLQEVLNQLTDIEKVTGGGAEAAWLALFMGVILSAKEGMNMPAEGTPENTKLHETLEAFVHRMQRYAVLEGVDVNNLGIHSVSIGDIFHVLISVFCGSKGIPQRILLGSERGELASTQDMQEWNGVIASRRTNFAEPEILDPFVNWCISHEVIPPPLSGTVKTVWQPVYTMTQMEEANYAAAIANGASAVTGGVPEEAITVDEWRALIHLPPMAEVLQIPPDDDTDNDDETVPPSNGKATEEELDESIPEDELV